MSPDRHPPRRRVDQPVRRIGGPERPANPRAVALGALARIEDDGGYANLVLAAELGRVDLAPRDRAFVTALVDGTTRMRRACDFLVDRFLNRSIEPEVRRVLRMGAFQLAYLATPPHAAVAATVEVAPRRVRGLVNAVLRRVSEQPIDPDAPPMRGGWPDVATRLSYPDWIVDRLTADLGDQQGINALVAMNAPARASVRADTYVQDEASRAVVDVVGARAGELIVDMCAAPGGKATAFAGERARVIAIDHTLNRASLIVGNAKRTGTDDAVSVMVADGSAPALPLGCADRVLVDAPCSGLGSLRRRADARWRIEADQVGDLAALQTRLLRSAAALVRPGGRLVYSVCTLTHAETVGVDHAFLADAPEFERRSLGSPWQRIGGGGRLVPTEQGRDGMTCFVYRRR